MSYTLRKVLNYFLVATTLLPCAIAQNQGESNKTSRASQILTPGETAPNVKKNGEWKDPEKMLQEVFYEGIPIEEVVKDLKMEFRNEFDVLLPHGSEDQEWNWSDTQVFLRLRNVKASEIFNAMNLVFEAGRVPLRWELMMNGRRPTALLRDVHQRVAPSEAKPAQSAPEKPMVFYVGDLIGDSGADGMTIDQVVQTVSEICKSALGHSNISTHKQAQLLIVRGTGDEISFVQETLSALREKTEVDAQRQSSKKRAESNQKTKEQTLK